MSDESFENTNNGNSTGEFQEMKPSASVSFIPPALLKREEAPVAVGLREKCAIGGIVLGGIALISWIVILFGAVFSIIGIAMSVYGLKSNYRKYAYAGLALSVLGLIASFWYVFAAYRGAVNYNYFTSEFWSKSTSTEVVK